MNFQTLGEAPQGEENGGADVKDVTTEGEPELAPEFGEGEKKKPQLSRETVGLLGVLAACGAVLLLMHLRNGPQSAGAADAGASPAGTLVSDFLSHGEEHVASMWQSLHDTDKFVEKFRTYPARPQVPLASLHTNPFRQAEARGPGAEPEGEGAVRRRREQERADVAKAAEALQLQSVLRGPQNACLINNSLYQQGQQVEGFVIEDITASSVIVRNGTYRFELRLGR